MTVALTPAAASGERTKSSCSGDNLTAVCEHLPRRFTALS